MHRFDHLIFAAPDLDRAVGDLEARLGVRAAIGGRHPAWATHNALIALSADTYLEIIAPEAGEAPPQPRPLGLDTLVTPRLATWVAKASELEELVARAVKHGVDLGAVRTGGRLRSDGVQQSWRMTDPLASRADGIVPFFIDWGDSPHPAATAPPGLTLIGFRAEHPRAAWLATVIADLGLELEVEVGPVPRLIARLETARGVVELA